MRRYRYRTSALVGPWRETPDSALRDAVSARQARIESLDEAGVKWLVPGEIEEVPLSRKS